MNCLERWLRLISNDTTSVLNLYVIAIKDSINKFVFFFFLKGQGFFPLISQKLQNWLWYSDLSCLTTVTGKKQQQNLHARS